MMFRHSRWLVVPVLLASAAAAAAECLFVQDNSMEEKETRYGITTAEWTADVRNDCDAPYDGTMTVKFKDADGRVLYKAVQIVAVRGGSRENARRRVNIPADKFKAIDTIDVAMEERERPR